MNKRIHVFYGLLLGLFLAFLGVYVYVLLFLKTNFIDGITLVKDQENLGKLITLGTIPNLVVFFVLLKKQREMWARGIVLATIVLAFSTLFYL